MGLDYLTPRPFTPKYFSGLKLWLSSDFGTFQDTAGAVPAVANNDPIGLWKDMSGLGNDFSQGTGANRPTLSVNARAGKNVITFNGTNNELLGNTGTKAISQSMPSMSGFCVLQTTASGTDRRALELDNGTGAAVRVSIIRESGGALTFGFRGSILDADPATTRAGGAFASGFWNNQEFRADCVNNLVSIFMDGTFITSGTFGTAGLTSNTASTNTAVGSAVGGNYTIGQIAEIILYVPMLTPAAQQAIEAYLRNRWRTP